MIRLPPTIPRLLGCALALSLTACAVVSPVPLRSPGASQLRSPPTPSPTQSTASTSAATTPTPTPTPTKKPAVATKPDCAKLKCIALTFDDGPYPDSARLARVMKDEKVRATFFMTGANVQHYPGVVKQILSTGSQLANHSWNHPDLTTLGDSAMRAQLNQTSAAITKASGRKVSLVRPPYGARNYRVDRLLKQLGLAGSLWNLDTLDWKFRDSARLQRCVLTNARRGDVVLMHDIHPTTVDAARSIFRGLEQRGFTFVTVSELHPQRQAGGYYPSLSGVRACN